MFVIFIYNKLKLLDFGFPGDDVDELQSILNEIENIRGLQVWLSLDQPFEFVAAFIISQLNFIN